VEADGRLADGRRNLEDETISVIILCFTLDRWDDLERAVASVREQTLRAHEVILVVDGNEDLKRRAEEQLDGVAVVMNAHTQGEAGGRQTGSEHATGTILAFIDDDAIADPDWLAELLRGYADPAALGVGGHIDPLWRQPPPRWFPEEFNWVVGCTYAGMPVQTTRIRNPIGANMSVWASVLTETGAFEARLGRVGGAKGMAGTAVETEFGIRTTRAHPGRYWVYCPQARVRHVVVPQRATWRYFLNRCRVEGRAKAVLTDVAGKDQALRSERIYVRSVLPRAVARELASACRGNPAGLARAFAIVTGLAVTTLAYASARSRALAATRGTHRN
jgi:glucosyl-dolichyl phosphate glucuronosyltransferase